MSQHNLFSALRAAFPSDLDSTAVETTAADGTPLFYTCLLYTSPSPRDS